MDKEYTHAQIFFSDKEKLKELKKETGYGSIAVVISKLLERYGHKLKG